MYNKIVVIALCAFVALNVVFCDEESMSGEVEKDPESYAEYSESHITKEAAEELRNRIRSSRKRDPEDDEYDDLLQELLSNPKPKDKKTVYYDKKYFDYLPSEESLSEQSQEKSKYPKKASSPASKNEEIVEDELIVRPYKRINSRRFRRDTTKVEPEKTDSKSKVKRSYYNDFHMPSLQIYHPPSPVLYFEAPIAQASHRTQYILPRQPSSYNPAYNAQPAFLMYNLTPLQPQPSVNRNVWANNGVGTRFHTPYNFYLPVDPHAKPPNTYLPPSSGETDKNEIDNRFMVDDLSSGLIFDRQYPDNRRPNTIDVNDKRPRPRPPAPTPERTTTPANSPSFVHDSENTDFDWNSLKRPTESPKQRTTTPANSPSFVHDSENVDFDWNSLKRKEYDRSPPAGNNLYWEAPPQQHVRPRPQAPQPQAPSRCVFAIVTCCSRLNSQVRYSCFERFNCHGAFWDNNPCTPTIIDAAAEEIERYSAKK